MHPDPSSPEWELEVSRSDFRMAARRLMDAQRMVQEATEDLVDAAESLGMARKAVELNGGS